MIRKKMYYKKSETGYILYIRYSLFGIPFYIKEKHIGDMSVDYSDL